MPKTTTTTERRRFSLRAIAVETAIVAVLGTVLAGASLGSLRLEYGPLHFDASDLFTAWCAGLAAAVVVRVVVRLHRRWKQFLGRYTAAAALCGVAALAGALVVMVPSHCPGGPPWAGRCGVKEAASWGQVAGLATVLNFMVVGIALAIFRTARSVIRDGSAQGVVWFRSLAKMWRSRVRKRPAPEAPTDPQEPKGRPTPRRSDAERNRRERLRSRS